jgi:hypothetical protein
MSKKKAKEVKLRDQPNPNHKRDFLDVLKMAAQPKQQTEK